MRKFGVTILAAIGLLLGLVERSHALLPAAAAPHPHGVAIGDRLNEDARSPDRAGP
jgi:hypothetical protein